MHLCLRTFNFIRSAKAYCPSKVQCPHMQATPDTPASIQEAAFALCPPSLSMSVLSTSDLALKSSHWLQPHHGGSDAVTVPCARVMLAASYWSPVPQHAARDPIFYAVITEFFLKSKYPHITPFTLCPDAT